MVGEAVVADGYELRDTVKVDLTALVVVEVVEVFHGHKGEDDHAEGKGIGGPSALEPMLADLQR